MRNFDIIGQLTSLGIAPEEQGKYVTAAVARAIAYSAPLPAQPDESFFQSTVAPTIAQQLDMYNESIPLDYPAITDLAQRLWGVRYKLLHPGADVRVWACLDLIANEQHIDFGVLRTDPSLNILSNKLVAG